MLSTLIAPLFLLGCSCIALHFYFHKKELHYKYRWLFGSGIVFLFISLGMFLSKQKEISNRFENINKNGLSIATIITPPKEKTNSYQLEIKTTLFIDERDGFHKTQGKAILYVSKNKKAKRLRVGDQIIFNTTLSAPKQRNNPEEFDYKKYLYRKGFLVTGFADSTHWQPTKKNEQFSIIQTASDIRNNLLSIYKEHHIEDDEFAVLAALTLGYKDEIQDELFSSYSNSGAMHILSVSGLHVGIIYLVFVFLLSFLNKTTYTRILKTIIVILLLWAYAFITGLSPSVVRATIMFSLITLAVTLNYKSQIYNTIFFSAFLLLLYDPNYLFNVGFLLSYSAVLSIVLFQPRFKKLLHFNNKPLTWAWDLFCVSVAAQIGTFPLGIYFFYKFSNYFLLTNFIAIPIATMIIYLAIFLFIISPFTVLSSWIAIALKWLLKAQNSSIVFIDKLPYSVSDAWINELEVILLYIIIAFTTAFFIKKRFSFLLIGILCFLSLQFSFIYRKIQSQQINEVVVYANQKFSALDFIDSNHHYYYTNDSVQFKKSVKAFWLKHKLTRASSIEKSNNFKNGFFVFHGKRFYLLTDSYLANKKTKNKLKIDYLVLANNTSIKAKDIENLFCPKNIIIDETISDWKTRNLIFFCKKRGIKYYSLKEMGCLTIKL